MLRDPHAVLGVAAQALDVAALRLSRALPQRLERDAQRLAYARDRLRRVGPGLAERRGAQVATAAARLDDLSPLKILGRGYAVCYAADGRTVLKSIVPVTERDSVRVRVGDGTIVATVISTQSLEERCPT